MDAENKEIIKILIKMARICGICPFEKPSRSSVLYHACIFCLLFSFSALSIYRAGSENYNDTSTMHICIDLLTSSFVTIQGCSNQLVSLLYPGAWRNLFNELDLVNGNEKPTKTVCIKIFILYLLLVAKIACTSLVWTTVIGWELSKYYIFRLLHEYYTILTIILMVYINLVVKKRFHAMNEILCNTSTFFIKKFDQNIQIREVEATYRKLLLVLEHFNSVFGYQILFIMANAVAVILECLRNALKHHDFNNIENVLIVGWSIISVIFVLVIAHQQLRMLNENV